MNVYTNEIVNKSIAFKKEYEKVERINLKYEQIVKE
jgi:hypothetical protein